MKVYGIWEGCIHEGGGCRSELYLSIEKCREVAKGLVSKKVEEWKDMMAKDMMALDRQFYKDHEWLERHPDYWHNQIDGISIQEFNVIE